MTTPLPEFKCHVPVSDDPDEVIGHAAAPAAALLHCWQCKSTFRIMGYPREDVLYACSHCHSLNQPDLSTKSNPHGTETVSRPPGSYVAPIRLDTVFLRSSDGDLYELQRDEAEKRRVGPDRLRELGHAPYVLPSEEVYGHHKTAAESAADPAGWQYHRDWQHGCYLDELSGEFCIGLHRHPNGDERAIGALKSDFS